MAPAPMIMMGAVALPVAVVAVATGEMAAAVAADTREQQVETVPAPLPLSMHPAHFNPGQTDLMAAVPMPDPLPSFVWGTKRFLRNAMEMPPLTFPGRAFQIGRLRLRAAPGWCTSQRRAAAAATQAPPIQAAAALPCRGRLRCKMARLFALLPAEGEETEIRRTRAAAAAVRVSSIAATLPIVPVVQFLL